MGEPETTHEMRLAGSDLEACRRFCRQHDVRWSVLCKLGWVIANGIYRGEPGVPTGALERHTNANGQPTILFETLQIDFDSTSLLSQVLESMNHRRLDGISSSSASAVVNEIAQMPNHGDKLVAITDTPDDEISLEVLRRSLTTDTLAMTTFALVTTMVDNSVLINCCTLSRGASRHAESAANLARTFSQIMLSIAASDRDACIGDLHAISPADRAMTLKMNARQIESVDGCVHQLIDAYGTTNPEKQALVYPDVSKNLSYAQLSSVTTALASILRTHGVSKGDAVPSLFEKSTHGVLATLATLKAGAAYIGLNSESPLGARILAVQTVGAKVVLTSRKLEKLAAELGLLVIVIDDDLLEECGQQNLSSHDVCHILPTDLAFIALTSGSTGIPKAIAIEHRSLVSFASAGKRRGWLREDMRALQFAAANFDAYVAETLVVLLVGGTVCVPTEDGRLNDLAGMIRLLRVNWFGATPSLCRTFSPSDVPDLRTLCVWGEANTREVLERWEKSVSMVNVYGPAECTCASSVNFYGSNTTIINNVGEPLDCAAYWVVSPWNHDRLVPFGAVGELMIQGIGVARGYLNDPVKTKAVFVDSPEWASTGAGWNRFYRTGDLVRQLPDHSFEYIGRIDKQVKLNGQRLELGEVEAVVTKALGDSLVVTVELVEPYFAPRDPTQSKPTSPRFLTAFFAPKATQLTGSPDEILDLARLGSIDFVGLRRNLQKYLRSFAIPRLFVPLLALPLTPIGKVDRKTLQSIGSALDERAISQCSGAENESGKMLHTPTELALKPLFCQVLNIGPETLTKTSDFFLLGGDSIKAIQLVKRARQINLHLTVPMVLLHPQFSSLASLATTSENEPPLSASLYRPFDAIAHLSFHNDLVSHANRLVADGRSDAVEDILPATDYQSSCVAWSTLETRGAINWLVFHLKPPQRPEVVEGMCKSLVENEGLLRTGFLPYRGQLYQTVFKSFLADVRTIDCDSDHPMDSVQTQVADADASRIVDIRQPQTAFALLRSGDGFKGLMVRLCHAQYDGQSVLLLQQSMTGLLNDSYLRNSNVTFAQYLHQARTHERKQGISYWQRLLKEAEMTELAIVQEEKPPVWLSLARGAVFRSTPSSDFQPPPGVSVNTATIIQAAWALTLAQFTGMDDVVFGATTWGRNAPIDGATTVFGSLLSHVPVRVRIGSDQTHQGLLHDVHAQRAESMQYESVGANTIVAECTPWVRWTRFTSLVVFQGLVLSEESSVEVDKEPMPSRTRPTVDVRLDAEIVAPADRTDLLLHVEPQHDGTTGTILRFSYERFAEATIATIMDNFLSNVNALVRKPDGVIEESLSRAQRTVSASAEVNPAIGQNKDTHVEMNRHGQGPKSLNPEQADGNSETHINSSEAVVKVSAAWEHVLGLSRSQLCDCRAGNVGCMSIWGNLVSCAGLAQHYRQLGHMVSTEDILRNQSMKDQETLLCNTPMA